MIDIETLGTEPGCAILSIGAVHFTAAGRGETLYRNIDRASCEDAGLEIDEETVKWWSEQDEAAQAVLSGGGGLRDALIDLAAFGDPAEEWWANSPKFDMAILKAAYERVDIEPPWEFYELRDVRTVKNLPGAEIPETQGVEHDALDDARNQAELVAANLQRSQEAER
jgi:inhibitor of KinA sporulation pathway (predicted exonuclease)